MTAPTHAEIRAERVYALVLLSIPVIVWGTTPRVTAVAGPHTDPIMLTALRAAPTAVFLLLLLPVLRYRMPRGRRAWFWTAASGVLMVTVFLGGFTEAIIRAGPGNAVVLASTSPFFVVLLSRLLLGERVPLQALGGLVVGFAGIILVVWSQLGGDTGGIDLAIGIAFALAAAFGWAAGTLMVKQLVVRDPETDLTGLTTGQYLVGGPLLLILAFGIEGTGGTDWSSGELWLSVAYISIVGGAIATLAYFGALKRLSATRVTAWMLLSPVVAVLLEIILGNIPEAIVLVGMAVTIAGVAMVNLAPQLEASARGEVAAEKHELREVS
jgi:drug/metabolite transporter (DMT)-like permease